MYHKPTDQRPCLQGRSIKKIMRCDDEVGKIEKVAPPMMARAVELFLQHLLEQSAAVARAKKAKVISVEDIKECVDAEEQFDFLRDLAARQVQEEQDKKAESAAKRPRKK
eukprot:TRINITY_DN12327_c0_g1_i7.p1 TRINITY_DN12327_c0_g1~~TRINITY_DN12327_c0_g1_i7.p1  ORF type:complete len:110 (+),score=38.50 TRINITY_DN12327_c0_g1_i7:290-619(+)